MREDFIARRGGHIQGGWLTAPEERAPNGESFVDLVERVIPAVERYTSAHAEKDIICVAHGGTIKAALAHALGLELRAGAGLLARQLFGHAPRPSRAGRRQREVAGRHGELAAAPLTAGMAPDMALGSRDG